MNDRLADALDAITTICITAIEKAMQEQKIADERSAEIIRLNARVVELTEAYEGAKRVREVAVDQMNISDRRVDILKEEITRLRVRVAGLEQALSNSVNADWQPIETAPKGGGAKMVTDPAWIEPPKLLLRFPNEAKVVCHWAWYYAEGGRGYRQGVSAWVESISGEPIALYYDNPTHWMPLPE